jgi:hypothetical protein
LTPTFISAKKTVDSRIYLTPRVIFNLHTPF